MPPYVFLVEKKLVEKTSAAINCGHKGADDWCARTTGDRRVESVTYCTRVTVQLLSKELVEYVNGR